jgi:hypothetical protein
MGEGKGVDVGEGEGCVMRCAAFRAVPRGEWPRKQQPKRHTCVTVGMRTRALTLCGPPPLLLSRMNAFPLRTRARTHTDSGHRYGWRWRRGRRRGSCSSKRARPHAITPAAPTATPATSRRHKARCSDSAAACSRTLAVGAHGCRSASSQSTHLSRES